MEVYKEKIRNLSHLQSATEEDLCIQQSTNKSFEMKIIMSFWTKQVR